MKLLIDALRAVCAEATQGDWRAEPCFVEKRGEDCWCSVVSCDEQGDILPYGATGKKDARHIATFDPPTVGLLLDVLEAAEVVDADAINNVLRGTCEVRYAPIENLSDALLALRAHLEAADG